MANTTIQIKRSSSTIQPASLAAAEPAYSYLSDKLFIGDAAGTGVIAIGGKYFIDQLNIAFAVANAAYGVANSSTVANAAYDVANAAFGKANAANVLAYNTGIGANAYASAVGVSANAYSDATFVKLTAGSQTITGNLSVVGSLTVAGNTYIVDAETLRVSDPLIYLAGNNYTSDIVDIGFIANYNNGSANLHTGLYREHTNKEYYLFQNYTEEPTGNHIDPTANGFTLAVLNADLITSNLTLGGANAIVWIQSAYDKANAANVLAYNTGIGANAYATSVGTSANVYATGVGAASNAWANTVGTSGNAYASAVGTSANVYASNVGTSANAYADVVGGAANTNAANASYLSTGTVVVARGGTGLNTITQNGIVYGNGTGAVGVTSAGLEGQVLQVNASGVPVFGVLDGGGF